MALALTPIVTFWSHGPAMHATAVLAGGRAPAESVGVLTSTTAALHLPGSQAA